ncbi:MAG: N-acetylmuramoyl-L-alanine amidase [Lachnospiraceae bacterium]|nr:N-acetylmuramoyl-L-alanine amidase [Lachnospiraceae bacterium]
MPAWITQDILRPGADSRPGTQIGPIQHIVVHYVGNVGSSAKDNRDYFEGNVDGRKVSSHFVIGMYGEILQCIPLNEVAYAQGIRQDLIDRGMVNHNYDSISIENCHPYENGKFTTETYWALVKLCAWLLEQYHLTPDALMRHYDATSSPALGVTGKACPLYFVQNPAAWEQFKQAVGQYMIEYPNIQ